ncbi:carbonic anhydrase 9 isoform X1 [Aquila chrysaetos chrysaetos]|uniref:Carbonic anhydrase n=1 Tax=Aquila chrysaetos chrysaetos TaxID=223781 RepID=A0A663FGE8_AQUCH|nr:carbonic anhydrase 9 isoform X1 [Aquila chrysaetos chrysaetos]
MSRAALRVTLLLLAALGRPGAGSEHDEEHGGQDNPSSREKGPGHSHWSYEDREHWGVDYPDCAGTVQSPINIDTAKTIFSPQLRPIQLSGYSLPANEKLKLRNNGHTVLLELPESLAITGGYAQQYRAVQLHLHWGSPSGPGSEHTVNGHRFAAEIHVVHYNTKYDSFKEAMVHPDGLAVLGAFLEVGPRENPYYQEILEHLYKIQREGEEVLVPGFNIAGLLPANLKLYFHYNGSLTTPPCYQTVKWTVFNQTMLLSHDQMSMLVMSLRNDDSKPLQNNYRMIQDLHRRRVLSSFQTTLFSVKQLPPGSDSSATTEGQSSSSFHAGDVLAVLFGVLFAITALAFLLYIYKHRSQNARLDSPTKSKVIYTAATTENTA